MMRKQRQSQTGHRQWLQHTSWILVSLSFALAASGASLRGGTVLAAEQPGELDLPACIERALSLSPRLRRAGWDVELAQGEVMEAQAGRWPRGDLVNLFGLVNRARGNAVFSPDEDTNYLDGLGPFTKLDLTINIPLYTFGKIGAGVEAAERGVGARQARMAGKADEVIVKTKELYYTIQLTDQISKLLNEVVKHFDEAIAKAEERLQKGKITQTDLIKLRLGKLRFEREASRVESAKAMTESAMAVALGLASGSQVRLRSRKLHPEKAEIRPLESYVELAFTHRPDWIALKEGLAAEEARLKVERLEYLPQFFLTGGLRFARAPNREDQKNPFVLDEFNFLTPGGVLGLHMSLNWWEIAAKVHQQRAKLEKLRADMERARKGVPLEVEKNYREVLQAEKAMGLASKSHRAARTLLVLTLTNFELGIGEPKEVFEGLGAFTEATASHYRAIHAFNMALANLSRAVGMEVAKLEYKRPHPALVADEEEALP